ncbi:hypothetical protein [Bradyrhizobium sp. BR13661]|jgi:hypothetical protein|uniref:hypothetical protein n=1 Tax=Bradyrhizobium sp. BR13661 TaxID=2940622 RepID=UPI002476A29A|nr:hypothetical protein [Bradyrhizobium sp. BR13661]MDH6259072.1 hypothetical protein [Bradyrhizobium sp. BR13661]
MTYCYAHFKAGPPSRILAALGPAFLKALESSVSYMDFRETIVRLNDAPNGRFTKAARRYAEVCSPGERELLKGILLLVDFAHVADEIAAGEAYGNMTRCSGSFREGFAACVVNAG